LRLPSGCRPRYPDSFVAILDSDDPNNSFKRLPVRQPRLVTDIFVPYTNHGFDNDFLCMINFLSLYCLASVCCFHSLRLQISFPCDTYDKTTRTPATLNTCKELGDTTSCQPIVLGSKISDSWQPLKKGHAPRSSLATPRRRRRTVQRPGAGQSGLHVLHSSEYVYCSAVTALFEDVEQPSNRHHSVECPPRRFKGCETNCEVGAMPTVLVSSARTSYFTMRELLVQEMHSRITSATEHLISRNCE
jgi:hypothetical protein